MWRLILLFAINKRPMAWLGGTIGRASDLRFIGRGFKSCLSTIVQWPWASYLHQCASVTKQYNLVLVKGRWRSEAGKVTVGLATHWPCVTDFVVYPPTGSGPRKGIRTLPNLTTGMASFYFTFTMTCDTQLVINSPGAHRCTMPSAI